MRTLQPFAVALVALALELPAVAQDTPGTITTPAVPAVQSLEAAPIAADVAPSPALKMMEEFKDSDVKFDVNELADILRDRRHEGWVLAAYPDPRTGQPLIGAGFSLDLPEREHPQLDAMNPHPFLEPSSADLWQAAGFDPARLNDILKVFYERKREWSKRTWRKKMFGLPAQISDDEAMQLVRVGAIQAIYNAKAYCRNFDQMTGPQQMAMAQLVYQMGVNLQHFNDFLTTINSGAGPVQAQQATAAADSALFAQAMQDATTPDAAVTPAALNQTPEYWLGVQKSLMGSQWAHKYRTRAIAVIAMLDPAYGDDPTAAEQRVGAVLRPAVVHHRGRHAVATTRRVSSKSTVHHGKKARHSTARGRSRKRA